MNNFFTPNMYLNETDKIFNMFISFLNRNYGFNINTWNDKQYFLSKLHHLNITSLATSERNFKSVIDNINFTVLNDNVFIFGEITYKDKKDLFRISNDLYYFFNKGIINYDNINDIVSLIPGEEVSFAYDKVLETECYNDKLISKIKEFSFNTNVIDSLELPYNATSEQIYSFGNEFYNLGISNQPGSKNKLTGYINKYLLNKNPLEKFNFFYDFFNNTYDFYKYDKEMRWMAATPISNSKDYEVTVYKGSVKKYVDYDYNTNIIMLNIFDDFLKDFNINTDLQYFDNEHIIYALFNKNKSIENLYEMLLTNIQFLNSAKATLPNTVIVGQKYTDIIISQVLNHKDFELNFFSLKLLASACSLISKNLDNIFKNTVFENICINGAYLMKYLLLGGDGRLDIIYTRLIRSINNKLFIALNNKYDRNPSYPKLLNAEIYHSMSIAIKQNLHSYCHLNFAELFTKDSVKALMPEYLNNNTYLQFGKTKEINSVFDLNENIILSLFDIIEDTYYSSKKLSILNIKGKNINELIDNIDCLVYPILECFNQLQSKEITEIRVSYFSVNTILDKIQINNQDERVIKLISVIDIFVLLCPSIHFNGKSITSTNKIAVFNAIETCLAVQLGL